MCHTINYYHHRHHESHRLIKLKSVTLHLSLSSATTTTATTTTALLPETLTFVFLPRINGTPLTINTSTFPSDSPAFLSLHRSAAAGTTSTAGTTATAAVFTSDDRVAFSEGAVFEVHLGENRLIHGVFRRCNDGTLEIECKCAAEREFGVNEAVLVAAVEDGGVMREKVKMTAAKRRRFCRRYAAALVEIPEERECDVAEDEEDGGDVEGSGVERCRCCCGDEVESDGECGFDHKMMEMEMEGVRWAVDVGIWAVCIGVGILVSKASIKSLRRRNKFLI